MSNNLTNEWYTAKELAGLPLMPSSDRSVRRLGLVPFRKRQKGKGYEYHISSLPKATQRALRIRHTKRTQIEQQKEAITQASQQGQAVSTESIKKKQQKQTQQLIAFNHLSQKEQSRVRARTDILAAWEVFIKDMGKIEIATRDFVEAYNNNELGMSATVMTYVPKVSRASLMRWKKAYVTNGPAGLSSQYKTTRASLIDTQPELLAFAEAVLAKMPHTTPANMLRLMEGEFDLNDGVRLPARKTVGSWMANWKVKNQRVFTAVANPDAYKNKYMVAAGDAREGIERLHQRWELDSSPADIMCTDGRFSLIACVDVYSADAIFMVRKNSDSYGIALVLRQAIIEWGTDGEGEQELGVDNGKDYASHFIQSVADSLGLKLAFTQPFAGEQKPFVERFFRTFGHHLSESLPGFIGHNVAERKAIEAQFSFADRLKRKAGSSKEVIEVSMSSIELQAFCNEWLHIYRHTEHSGIGGKTPMEKVRDWPRPVRRIKNERVLDLLLEPIPGNKGERTVQKKGIKLDGGWFIATELGARVGDRVMVRYDGADAGRIYVFEGSGEFVCMAQNPTLTGVSRKDIAQAMKQHERDIVGEQKKALKAKGRKLDQRALVQKALDNQKRKIDEKYGNVTELPRAGLTHETNYINGAEAAIEAADNDPTTQHFDKSGAASSEMIEAMEHVMHSRLASGEHQPETDTDRFQRWIRLHEALQRGETLNELDEQWKKRHEQTSEWKGNKMVFDSFGKEAFGLGK